MPVNVLSLLFCMKVITRKEALAKNLKTYFTGQPCKRGHVDIRTTNNKICVSCHKIGNFNWRKNNPTKIAHIQRKCRLKRFYGMSLDNYDAIFQKQKGCCMICKLPSNNKLLEVDHNHTTGIVRGLLCNQCNTALGLFKDSVKFLKSAIHYLEDASQC